MEQITSESSLQLSEELTGLFESLAKMWSPRSEISAYHRPFRDIRENEKALIRACTDQMGESEVISLGVGLFRKFHARETSDTFLQMGNISAPTSQEEFISDFTRLVREAAREKTKDTKQSLRERLAHIFSGLRHPSGIEV